MDESLTDLLAGLDDIVVPEPVSWAPQTPGWLALMVLLLLAVGLIAVQARARYRANAYRRAALVEMDRIEARLASGEIGAAAELAALPRRVALAVWERETVVPLSGDAWIEFLERTAPGVHLDDVVRGLLLRAPYVPADAAVDEAALRATTLAVRRWVKRHRA